jgi:hypothetical protein
MADRSLPDNVEDWPRDPFALFGVNHSVSAKEVRRIYTRLIREYKPERSPEQFRRVREAYETLQRYALWNEPDATESDERRSAANAKKPSHADQPGPMNPTPAASGITEEECWRWARAGDVEGAYRSLINLRDQQPQQASLYLRLYWLAVAFPELDRALLPRDWLSRGLEHCAQYARLLDNYTEELGENPAEALSERFGHLLGQASGTLLCELLERRWHAAAKLQSWDIVWGDLEVYREVVCRDDEVAWLRLLLSLASKSIKSSGHGSVFQACLEGIRALDHLGIAHGDLFDRAEVLHQVAEEMVGLPPGAVLDVTVHYLAGRREEAAACLEPFLSLTVLGPEQALEVLDHARAQAPLLFIEYCRAVDWFSWDLPPVQEHSAEIAARLVDDFWDSVSARRGYYAIRGRLFKYCCEEALPPVQVARMLAREKYQPNILASGIASDLALICAYQTNRLAWKV